MKKKRHVRGTSKAVYHSIVASGLLGEMQQAVFDCLYRYGPMTGSEIDEKLTGSRGHYHKRLSELKKMDVVEEVGKRTCKVTGRVALVWGCSGRIARKYSPSRSRAERYRKMCLKLADYMEFKHAKSGNSNKNVAGRIRGMVEKIG